MLPYPLLDIVENVRKYHVLENSTCRKCIIMYEVREQRCCWCLSDQQNMCGIIPGQLSMCVVNDEVNKF